MRTITTIIILFLVMVTVYPAIAGESVQIFEMGESGQFVSFPMTEQDIAAEDARKVRPRAVDNRKATKDDTGTVIFELAESGLTIDFPDENVEISIEDVAETDAKAKVVQGKRPNG